MVSCCFCFDKNNQVKSEPNTTNETSSTGNQASSQPQQVSSQSNGTSISISSILNSLSSSSSLKNVDIYPLICGLLKINCNKNNGTVEPFLSVLNDKTLKYVQTELIFN